MNEFEDRAVRRGIARAEYEKIMTVPSPEPIGAFIESGVIGFVFGEMWRRGVLTARDRRWITLACVGAADAPLPIDGHVWAALNSGEVTYPEFDEFVLHFATQLGWPKASALQASGAASMARLAQKSGHPLEQHDFDEWAEPADDDVRRERGLATYADVHGVSASPPTTPFRGRFYIDFMYGEVWARERYLTRRDRRIISICCAAAAGIDEETTEHLRAALESGDLSYTELQEAVVHFTVYSGWLRGRRLDDLLESTAGEVVANRDL